jgi:hypothetical protein
MGLPFFRQFSPGLQFLVFLMIHFLGMGLAQSISGVMGMIFWKINVFTSPETLIDFSNTSLMSFHRMAFVFFSLFGFVLPALVFRRYMELPDQDYLFIRKGIKGKFLLVVFVVVVLAFPVINLLHAINQLILLPGEIGNAINQSDFETQVFTVHLLYNSQYETLITNLVVVALLPALGEELFFRPVVLRMFSKMFKRVHVAVWMGALFFSIYHMNFQGLIPRLFMGALLGYVFIITGNIWYTVWLHFLNNAFIVVLAWVNARGTDTNYLDEFGTQGPAIAVAIVCLIGLTAWGIYLWRKSRHYQIESEMLYR